jgi:hypothetical protein
MSATAGSERSQSMAAVGAFLPSKSSRHFSEWPIELGQCAVKNADYN